MQRDFHYYTTRILAEKAGFAPEDAQIIAYACEYVDDAYEHSIIKVKGNFNVEYPRYDGENFDPICTAHAGLQMINGFNTDIQRKIYFSFHFIPEKPFTENESFSYLTRPNGIIARKLVNQAILDLCKKSGDKRIQKLIKLGIALHSFADTWAHQDFSGRHNEADNDVENISIFKNDKWEKLSFLEQTRLNALPCIGHAEAGSFTDYSHLIWKYTKVFTKQEVIRNNPEIFLEAAHEIFKILGGDLSELYDWKEIEEKLKICFTLETEDLEEKFKTYKNLFPEIGFNYDSTLWKNEAIESEKKKITKMLKFEGKEYLVRTDRKWFFFHIEAYKQRNYVLSLIPPDIIN